jgi:hypothetical protein
MDGGSAEREAVPAGTNAGAAFPPARLQITAKWTLIEDRESTPAQKQPFRESTLAQKEPFRESTPAQKESI